MAEPAEPSSDMFEKENLGVEETAPATGETPNVSDRSKRKKRRSNRPYPPASFEEAANFAREIHDFFSGIPVRKLSFFDHVGKSPDSSQSRDAITNANKYGLLKSSFASEMLELTDDALSIVAENVNIREQTRAKVKLAIQNIEPFDRLYERIAGNRLPPRPALLDGLKDVGIPEDFLEEAADLLIVNLRFVGLLQVLSGAERVVSIDLLLDHLPTSQTRPPQEWSRPPQPEASLQKQTTPNTEADLPLDQTCFYVTPIGSPGSDPRRHSDLFLSSIVEPAISALGLKVVRADMIGQPGIITRQILDYILRSRLVIADLSFHNPNVFYELALRHAIRLPIVQIVRRSDSIPFDINQMRTIEIDNTDLYSFVPNIESYKSEIATQARRALEAGIDIETPISIYFPNLKVALE